MVNIFQAPFKCQCFYRHLYLSKRASTPFLDLFFIITEALFTTHPQSLFFSTQKKNISLILRLKTQLNVKSSAVFFHLLMIKQQHQ